jgi:hypothetical protein
MTAKLPKADTPKTAPLEGEVLPVDGPSDKQVLAVLDKVEGVAERKKLAVIESHASKIMAEELIVSFYGRLLLLVPEPYSHFVPLGKDRFDKIAYPILGGVPRSMVGDVFAFIGSMAEDYSNYSHLIGFGQTLDKLTVEADTDLEHYVKNVPLVWNMRSLTIERGTAIEHTIWRSPQPVVGSPTDEEHKPLEFVMQLAGGDQGVYDDIMQSLAPMVMEKKPDGVIWWVGSGANGKSTLMDAIYRLFPGQLASINVRRLTDGRDTPSLNGKLANVVKESSEGRVDDTEIYKALGTHENFRVHKFHSQEDVEINGNIHTIFSANTIPTFNDKGYSARRRTFIIPFTQQFDSDPNFEAKTFTPEFFGRLASEMCRYASRLKQQGYRYKWSARTRDAKLEYDKEANCAEEYAQQIIEDGVVAFRNFNPLRTDYENWCAENGYVPLGLHNLRKALTALGFERSSSRDGNRVTNLYKLPDIGTSDLQSISPERPGLLTTSGFAPTPVEPETPAESTGQTSILGGKW